MKKGIGFIGVGTAVLLEKDGKILLLKRKGAHGEGSWCMPGGSIDVGESFRKAAEREVKEETGMDVKYEKIISVSNDIMYGAHWITLGAKAIFNKKQQPKLMEPEKCSEIGWFSLNKLPNPMFHATQMVINNYKKGVIIDESLQ